jgi:hypothetical protein
MKWRPKKSNNTNNTKSWFFEKINKIDKPLTKLIKRNNTQIIKTRDKRGI